MIFFIFDNFFFYYKYEWCMHISYKREFTYLEITYICLSEPPPHLPLLLAGVIPAWFYFTQSAKTACYKISDVSLCLLIPCSFFFPLSFPSAISFFFVAVHNLGPAARSTSRPSCILTGKRAVNASRKLRAENTLVEENNGARRKEIANTAAWRKITLMYLYNGPKSSFIMTRDSLGYSATRL